MCMKNININTLAFNKLSGDMSSIRPFNSIVAEETPEGLLIRDFNVLILVSAIISTKEVDAHKCILKNNEYNVLIRLTHMRTNYGMDLESYTLTFDDNSIHEVCKPIFESKRVINAPNLLLPKGAGHYAIKVFIKHKDDEMWFVQSIQRIVVDSDG